MGAWTTLMMVCVLYSGSKSIDGHLGLQECGVAAKIEHKKSGRRKLFSHLFLPSLLLEADDVSRRAMARYYL
jgi:hypothetical protein